MSAVTKIEDHGFQEIPITDREQWLALRRQDVTASVSGALLGVHEYVTPFSLYAHKAGMIENDPEETGALAEDSITVSVLERGHLYEPVAVSLIQRLRPTWQLSPGVSYFRDPVARLGATPDLFAIDPERGRGVIQIKSVEQSVFKRKWISDDGTIEPPLWIVCQAIIEAHLTGALWAAVAPVTIGFDLSLHLVPVPIHAGVIDRIRAANADFWGKIAKGEAPNPDFSRDGELLAKLYVQENGETIDLSGDNELPNLLSERANIKEQLKGLDQREKEIKAQLLSKIGAASLVTLPGWKITAKTIEKKPYSVTPKPYREIRVKELAL